MRRESKELDEQCGVHGGKVEEWRNKVDGGV